MDFNVITLFKNYSPTYFTFRNFYNKLWGVKKFIYFIGYITDEDKNYIYNTYIINHYKKDFIGLNFDYLNNLTIYYNNDNNIENVFLLYKTINKENYVNYFNNIKDNLFSLLLNNIIDIKQYYISVDDDEFLYSSDMDSLKEKIKKEKIVRFHFVESYPHNDYKQLKWCMQSWYIHRISVDNPICYNCNACKSYMFKLHKNNNFNITSGFWIHSCNNYYNNSSCEKIKNKDYIDISNIEVCFHITGLTIKNLKYTKFKNRFINKIENAKDGPNGNYVNFDKYFDDVNKYYRIFDNNIMLSYIDNRDIELLREI